jgi:hypothetical protein
MTGVSALFSELGVMVRIPPSAGRDSRLAVSIPPDPSVYRFSLLVFICG